ncbi:MAG: (Fe-S)-binding protein [Myxococcota bacterium]
MTYEALKPFLFAVFFLGSMGLFAHSVWRMVRLARLGQDHPGLFSDLPDRIGKVIYFAFFQRKVVQYRFGWNHVIIFWSFLIITVGHTEFLLRGMFPSFSLSFLGTPIYSAILFGGDMMAFIVLFAVAAALFRRLVLKPSWIHISSEGFFILGLITMVMVTYFLATAFAIRGAHSDVAGHEYALVMSSLFSTGLSGFSVSTAAGPAYEIFWWSHAVVLMVFLNVIPHSKHIHLLGAIPNIFLYKKDKPSAALTRLDFENSEIWGVSQVNQLSFKALVDTYACTECGRCDMHCPARRTGKPLEPQQLIHDIRDNLYENGDKVLAERKLFDFSSAPAEWEPPLALIADSEADRKKGQTSADVLWSCTSCGACVEACPVLIDHVDTIMDLRRNQAMMIEGGVSTELANTYRNLENQSNPWGVGADKREDWAKELGLKIWDSSDAADKFEFLFWVGCAGSFDNRAQKTVKAFSEILDAAGVTYAVLGNAEGCTGDTARRTGNEYMFDTMAQSNVETLNDMGVKKVVTACPHCFNTLQNEYPAFGGNYEVVHHTQLIDQLIQDDRIELDGEMLKKVTFHDPCFLGRWNNETEAPRRSLAAVKRLQVVEMKEHGKKSFCCGAGGGQMWMEEHLGHTRVNLERTKHALDTGADVIAVGCPFCMTMMEDGVKNHDAEEKVQVLDVAEVVRSAMKTKTSDSAS